MLYDCISLTVFTALKYDIPEMPKLVAISVRNVALKITTFLNRSLTAHSKGLHKSKNVDLFGNSSNSLQT